MNQQCRNGSIKRPCNEIRPLQILLNNQNLICFLPQENSPLNLSDISRLLGFTRKRREMSLLEKLPLLSSKILEKGSAGLGKKYATRYPSSFIQLFLKAARPSSVVMVRWLVQEVIPGTAIFKEPLATVTDDPQLLKLLGRCDDQSRGQILINLKTIRTGTNSEKPSTSEKGDKPCLKH